MHLPALFLAHCSLPSSQTTIHLAHTLSQNGSIIVDDRVALIPHYALPIKEKIEIRVEGLVVCLCEKGSISIMLNSTLHTVESNQLLVCLPYSQVGHYERSHDFEGCILYFSLQHLYASNQQERASFDRIMYLNANPKLDISTDSMQHFNDLQRIIEDLQTHNKSPRFGQMVESLFHTYFLLLLDHVETSLPPLADIDQRISRQEVLFKRFFALLSSESPKHREVTYYAERLFITPKYLSAICKRITGHTATTIIHQNVIEDAKQLLLHSDLSIKEVAAQLDFSNVSFFGKYIKSHLGVSPLEYRKQKELH